MTEEKTKKPPAPSLGVLFVLILFAAFLSGFAWSMGDAMAFEILDSFEESVDYGKICSQLEAFK